MLTPEAYAASTPAERALALKYEVLRRQQKLAEKRKESGGASEGARGTAAPTEDVNQERIRKAQEALAKAQRERPTPAPEPQSESPARPTSKRLRDDSSDDEGVQVAWWAKKQRGPDPSEQNDARLFVSGVGSLTEEELRRAFSKHGDVVGIRHVTGRDFAFVTFGSVASAEAAIAALNNSTIEGFIVRVDKARPAAPRGPPQSQRLYSGARGIDDGRATHRAADADDLNAEEALREATAARRDRLQPDSIKW